jgi:hypothetical protein
MIFYAQHHLLYNILIKQLLKDYFEYRKQYQLNKNAYQVVIYLRKKLIRVQYTDDNFSFRSSITL